MKKVYVLTNCDECIFGVFTSKQKADYVCKKMKTDYPNDDINVSEYKLDVIKSWVISKELDELGIQVVTND